MIKELEIEKLFKELEYVESDYKYHDALFKIGNNEFLKSVDSVLESYPDLKPLIKNEQIIEDAQSYEDNVVIENADTVSQKLFRKIVKLTHPDKVKNEYLNLIYLKANNYYNENDRIGLFNICSVLNIKDEDNEVDVEMIKERITMFKNRIDYTKKSWAYKWATSDDKNSVLLSYLQEKIK